MKNPFRTKHYCTEHHMIELEIIKNDCANSECEKEFVYCRECGLQKGEHL